MSRESRTLARTEKFRTVMREFGRRTLRSGSGQKVTSREQALAIAFSEARKRRKKKGGS